MESLQNIKKRIRAVSNIHQITKAMELVAATKMRKSQQIALDSRPYSFAALELLANLSIIEEIRKEDLPPLFQKREDIKKVLFVLVASDKGLVGAFNNIVFKKFERHRQKEKEEWKKEEKLYVAVGEKAFSYLKRKGFPVLKKFIQVGDYTSFEQTKPLAEFLMKGYLNREWDRVIIISMNFRSALKQEPHVRRILPVDFDHLAETIVEIIPERGKFAELIKEQNISFVPNKNELKDYLIEPYPKIVLSKLSEHLFFTQVYQLILEANASEHAARRLAMKNASDNAIKLKDILNLQYNKSRQAVITKEITEITAGAESLLLL